MREDDNRLNLPKREEKILEFWERNKIFEKTLARTKNGRPFVFYEGPPTANAAPGIHHVEARSFKDVIPRFKTMQGFFVERKAGWDTHGLPVEIQVEKALGLKTKKDIEQYGIAKFNAKCRESVWQFKAEWEKLTKRIGFWLDLEHPYITYETSYIETLWWIIKEIWKRGLLYQDFKVVPWCPRCETALSTHELGQGYKTVKDRSVYVRFRVKARSRKWENTSILSWTTTPWTLPGNVALAINPNEEYICVPDPDTRGRWVVLGNKNFEALVGKGVFPAEYRNKTMLDDIDIFSGKEMIGIEYEPLFPLRELIVDAAHHIYAADFVSAEEGTGVVHTAVMYGEDDYQLGKKIGLPAFHTVTETGHFIKELGEGLGGLYVKDSKTEDKIIASLKQRGLLFKEEMYEHEYPHCWRCDTPLLYYARQAWWVRMSELRKQLAANNEKINWIPDYIKRGRFGEFLKEARDWAFSRERYWGTPLPVWQCQKCRHEEVAGSLEELAHGAVSSGNSYFAMRHGQSETQMLGISDNDKNTFHLTPRGRKEVLSQAKRLAKEKIDLIVSSPVLRTRETADIVSKATGGVKVVADKRLAEINVGVFEHKPVSQYHEHFSSTLEKFTKRPPAGESLNDLKARLMSLMEDLEMKHRGKKILLISHEYPIWILWSAAQGLSDRAAVEAREKRRGDFVKTAEMLSIPFKVLPRDESGDVNLHRPFIDEFTLECPKCQSKMQRVSEVIDVWFDSGAMPFAQHHYPFEFAERRTDKDKSTALSYPADYICEAIDQTRGWFYTLLAVSTLLGRGNSYRNVISLGHVLDKNGQKMSKSKGNAVNPWEMIEKYGADAIRWYFYTINAPGDPKRFDEKDLALKLRGTLSTLWNSFVFFDTYVNRIRNSKLGIRGLRNVLDRWVLIRIEEVTDGVTMALDRYDIVSAARALEQFIIEDFSNWYLRRSRRRFQKPENPQEKKEAEMTITYALVRLAELSAPFIPFFADVLWQELKRHILLKEASVHLRAWPKAKATKGKIALLLRMRETRKLVASALALRAEAGIKVRQPLVSLEIPRSSYYTLAKHPSFYTIDEFIELIKDEVNVKAVRFGQGLKLDTKITPELREEGLMRELIRNIQELRRDAGFKPGQLIMAQASGDRKIMTIIERWKQFVQKEAGVKELQVGGKKNFIAEREIKIESAIAWVGIRKA